MFVNNKNEVEAENGRYKLFMSSNGWKVSFIPKTNGGPEVVRIISTPENATFADAVEAVRNHINKA